MKALRYMMAAVLVLAMLCASVAMAATVTPLEANKMNNPTTGLPVTPTTGPNKDGVIDIFKIEKAEDDKSFDWEYQVWDFGKWVTITGAGEKGVTAASTNAYWNYLNTVDVWLDKTGEEKVRLVVTSHKKDGTDTVTATTFYVDWNTDPSVNDRLTFSYWLPHNTACVYGPRMADLVPGVTNRKNLTAAVVDLTKEGTQSFKLVAADQWEIGKVFVNVTGDEVTVTYQMTEDINTRDIWDEIIVEKEWFTIFPTKASITSAKRDDLGDGYTFGAPISIANDLGGATTVVLYVNSTVTYGTHNPYVYRFWTNSYYETGARNAMQSLFNSVAD